jgi:hypothetical protein
MGTGSDATVAAAAAADATAVYYACVVNTTVGSAGSVQLHEGVLVLDCGARSGRHAWVRCRRCSQTARDRRSYMALNGTTVYAFHSVIFKMYNNMSVRGNKGACQNTVLAV